MLSKIWAACVVLLLSATALAGTHMPSRIKDARKLAVVREYVVVVEKGKKSVARVPAMMSFWGATNQQTIQRSEFTYSVKPDTVTTVPAKDGVPFKMYELTWEAPSADSVKITQKMLVEISCTHALATAAKLPYAKEVQEFYATSLAKTDEINPENPKLEAVAKAILAKSKYAADAMELAAVWVDESIQFKSMANGKSDAILADGQGNCTGMSKVLVALLRKLGIPAETVTASFVGGGGHEFVEAYLPDAGWIFFDPSNGNHAFKSCDVLMTAGWGYLTLTSAGPGSGQGPFLTATDVVKYEEPPLVQAPIRPLPKDKTVAGVRVVYQATPKTVQVRHLPLSKLMADEDAEPGQTTYKPTPAPWAEKKGS